MLHNDRKVHAVGNGNIIAYGQGVNLIQVFGAPHSSPNLATVKVESSENYNTTRMKESDIHIHESDSVVIKDFCHESKPIFIREFRQKKQVKNNIKITLEYMKYVKVDDISFKYDNLRFKNGRMLILQAVIDATAPVFFYYPVMKPIYYNIILKTEQASDIKFNINTEKNIVELEFSEGVLAFVGGPDYPECSENTKYALTADIIEIEKSYKKHWEDFFSKTKSYDNISDNVPKKAELLKAVEAVKIALKNQQDRGGGVLAGYPFHMGYVRDQFGVAKGMIKLGMIDEVKKVLLYFYNEFCKTGFIANAQGLSMDGIKHIHENDFVEITGYIILIFIDCLAVLEEDEKKQWAEKMLPMTEWALDAQCSQIVDGMLPFNGDETYIAGGILPRNIFNHGSSESTVIFMESAKKLLSVVDKYSLTLKGDRKYYDDCLNECINKFKQNFMPNGKLVTNNPERETLNREKMPKYRHGVCEGYCGFFGWLEKGSSLYLCTDCLKKEFESSVFPQENLTRYYLKSVSLLPIFIDSEIVTAEHIKTEIDEIAYVYKNTKMLPSHPDGDISLGYDYGYLLKALHKSGGHKETARQLFEHALEIVDESYTWSEYYNNNIPSGTMYRPWESGINISVLLDYAESIE